MLAGTRCERCHQVRGLPERAIQSCQEIAKGHEPRSAATRGGDYWKNTHGKGFL